MPGTTPKCKSLSLLAKYFYFYFIAYTVTKSSINTKLMKEVQQGRSCTLRKFLCLFSEEQLETFEYVPMYNLNYSMLSTFQAHKPSTSEQLNNVYKFKLTKPRKYSS